MTWHFENKKSSPKFSRKFGLSLESGPPSLREFSGEKKVSRKSDVFFFWGGVASLKLQGLEVPKWTSRGLKSSLSLLRVSTTLETLLLGCRIDIGRSKDYFKITGTTGKQKTKSWENPPLSKRRGRGSLSGLWIMGGAWRFPLNSTLLSVFNCTHVLGILEFLQFRACLVQWIPGI